MAWCHVLVVLWKRRARVGSAHDRSWRESPGDFRGSTGPAHAEDPETSRRCVAGGAGRRPWETVLTVTPVSFITCEFSGEYFLTLTGKLSSGRVKIRFEFQEVASGELTEKGKDQYDKAEQEKSLRSCRFLHVSLSPTFARTHILIGAKYSFSPQTCAPLRTRNSDAGYAEQKNVKRRR